MKTLLALMLVLTLPVSTAFGQAWPNRPFRMVVPAAAGGTIDILTRALSVRLSEGLGPPVVVGAAAVGAAPLPWDTRTSANSRGPPPMSWPGSTAPP